MIYTTAYWEGGPLRFRRRLQVGRPLNYMTNEKLKCFDTVYDNMIYIYNGSV